MRKGFFLSLCASEVHQSKSCFRDTCMPKRPNTENFKTAKHWRVAFRYYNDCLP